MDNNPYESKAWLRGLSLACGDRERVEIGNGSVMLYSDTGLYFVTSSVTGQLWTSKFVPDSEALDRAREKFHEFVRAARKD